MEPSTVEHGYVGVPNGAPHEAFDWSTFGVASTTVLILLGIIIALWRDRNVQRRESKAEIQGKDTAFLAELQRKDEAHAAELQRKDETHTEEMERREEICKAEVARLSEIVVRHEAAHAVVVERKDKSLEVLAREANETTLKVADQWHSHASSVKPLIESLGRRIGRRQ